MSFLNPWAIGIGLLALAAPLMVHWLTRPRPRPMPLSTIHFVFEAIRQRRSRHRLRDILVLLFRSLAIALLAFAVARPLWRTSVIDLSDTQVQVARVVILDVSQSMAAGRGGNQPLERARSVADKYLSGQPGLAASVILAAARPESVFEQFSSNLTVLRQTIRQVQAKPQAGDAQGAIALAAQWLAETDPQMQRELVVISDFQRADWGAVRLDALPNDTKIQMESVALNRSDNVAVLSVGTDARSVVGEPLNCQVEVGNFSDVPRPLQCRLQIGEISQTLEQTFPPGQSSVTFPLRFQEAGWRAGLVTLLGTADDLPADDLRPWVLETLQPPRVVLLSDQDPRMIPSSSYYLQRALGQLVGIGKPQAAGGGVLRIAPEQLTTADLQQSDLIVLAQPGRLTPAVIEQLAASLRRGKGMLYVVSDLADGVNLMALQKELGAAMQMPVRFVPPKGQRTRRDLAISEVSRREAPFAVFGDTLDSALATVRLGGGLATEPTEESLQDRVLAHLSDRSALLTVTECAGGRLAVLNADLQQSNLATQAPFVPLMGELVTLLLPDTAGDREAVCGAPLVRMLPGDVRLEDPLQVRPTGEWPASADGYGNWEPSAAGLIWNWPYPDQPGVYEVVRQQDTLLQVAVATPASESDLSSLQAGTIDLQGEGQQQVGFRNVRDSDDDKDRWWNWLLVACVLGLMCELATLRIFRT